MAPSQAARAGAGGWNRRRAHLFKALLQGAGLGRLLGQMILGAGAGGDYLPAGLDTLPGRLTCQGIRAGALEAPAYIGPGAYFAGSVG